MEQCIENINTVICTEERTTGRATHLCFGMKWLQIFAAFFSLTTFGLVTYTNAVVVEKRQLDLGGLLSGLSSTLSNPTGILTQIRA